MQNSNNNYPRQGRRGTSPQGHEGNNRQKSCLWMGVDVPQAVADCEQETLKSASMNYTCSCASTVPASISRLSLPRNAKSFSTDPEGAGASTVWDTWALSPTPEGRHLVHKYLCGHRVCEDHEDLTCRAGPSHLSPLQSGSLLFTNADLLGRSRPSPGSPLGPPCPSENQTRGMTCQESVRRADHWGQR